MKHWQESRLVFEWLATVRAEQRHAALATVISVHGSAYRREGAKMAVADDGASVGNVSGGCLELDVREVALEVIASGVPQLRTYCSGGDEIRAWDLGVGCEGEVRVLVEPVTFACGIEQTLFSAGVPFAVCTVVEQEPPFRQRHRLIVTDRKPGAPDDPDDPNRALIAEARAMLATGSPPALREIAGRAVFVDAYCPPPQLLIVSAGNDARPLARFGVEVGFRTIVVDRRPALLTPDRFPAATSLLECSPADLVARVDCSSDTCAVVMTHNFADDEQYLRALIPTRVPYLGVLGPRQRTERLITAIAADTPFDRGRIYGPVGLDVGTDGAEQVALAVIAELLAVRAGHRPRSLREREQPIHARLGEFGRTAGS